MNKFIQSGIIIFLLLVGRTVYAQPTMSLPTVSGITDNSATLGGTIAGPGILARGTAWKTTSPVAVTDNQLALGVTSAGTYTHARTGLPSGTQIFFVAYGTNGGGTAISGESSFYTLSAPPIGQPTFTATTIGATQINLSFNNPATHVSIGATGYAIYRIIGGTNPAITAVNLPNAAAPPTSLPDGSIFIGTTATNSYSDNSVVVGNQYRYAAIPFGDNGSIAATFNYFRTSYPTASASTQLPTVNSPTATNISETDANLGGTITTNGGNPISERGTIWKTSAGVTIGDNKLAEGGTSVALFTDNRSALPPGTQIFYRAYATTVAGSGLSSENSFYTFSITPDDQPNAFTATEVSKNQINLASIQDFTTLGNTNGYVILRSIGSDPLTTSVQDGVAPTSLVLGSSALVTTITTVSATYSDGPVPPLTPGTQYNYAVVPFNWDGLNPQTYNYKTGGGFTTENSTTFFAKSTITLNGGTQSGGNSGGINYITFPTPGGAVTNVNSASLAQFGINDTGGNDGVGTTLTALTFNLTNSGNVSRIAIFDGATNLAVQNVSSTGTVSITFNSLSIAAGNNGTETFQIRATFNSVVTDNQQINLTITSATASSSGSDFDVPGTSLATALTSNANAINVDRTKLAFNPSATINGSANVNLGLLSVRALDANNNLDVDAANTVTLSLNPLGSTITSTPSNGSSVSSGVINFTNLSINTTGSFTMTASGTGGVTAATITVNLTSPGATITPGTASTLCYSGSFQNLTNITITEFDNADFAVGSNRTFSLILPSNFIFDTSVTTTPLVSGGGDISAASVLSYIGSDIVRFSYTITGTANQNTITIGGLKVKYIGTSPASGNILRLGGSAVQQGNADTDLRNHGTLSSANSATVVSFVVQELSGNPTVNSAETRFSTTSPPVKLLGTPASGVFTGNGVSFSSGQSSYIFTPGSVGVGSYSIVYTYTEVSGQNCQVSTAKTFIVSTGVIGNLSTQYCTNGLPSTGLNVTQAQIDALFAPANSHTFNDFVFYDPSLTDYVPISTPNNTTFNPSVPAYLNSQNIFGAVYVYYRVRRISDNVIFFAQLQLVNIFTPPVVTLNIPKLSYCVDDAPIVLSPTVFASPTPSATIANDFFTANGSGTPAVSNTGSNQWVFDPSNVTNATSSQQTFNIFYTYKNTATNCSSNSATQTITVNPRPSAVLSIDVSPFNASLTPDNNVFTCLNTSPSSFSGTSILGTTYKWYADAPLTDLRRTGNLFTPVVNVASTGTTNFYMTRTINGCESSGLQLAVTVKPNVTVDAGGGAAATICSGSQVDLVAQTPSITGAVTTGVWSIVSGTGDFLDASNANVNLNPTLAIARKFDPIPNTQSSVRLRLTSSVPSTADANNPCPSVFDDVIITITPNATASPIALANICAPFIPSGQPNQSTMINLSASILGAGTASWSIISGGSGNLASTGSLLASNLANTYTSTITESLSGTTLMFRLTTADPDGLGPCLPAVANVSTTINPSVIVNAGNDLTVCAGVPTNAVTLTGAIGGSASTGIWSGGAGSFSPPSITTTPSATLYAPTLQELTQGASLSLRLTTNNPVGGICFSQASTMNLTINPIPPAPLVTSSGIANTGSSASPVFEYCSGINFAQLVTTPSSNGSITWYSDAGLTAQFGATPIINPALVVNNITTKSQAVYATETRLNCRSAGTPVTVVVHPLPAVNFDATSFCLGDFMDFQDLSTISAPAPGFSTYSISNWNWNFGDFDQTGGFGNIALGTNSGRTIGTYNKPQHKYASINAFNVTLAITSNKGCVSPIAQKIFNVGPVPQSDFSLLDICKGDITKFKAIAGLDFDGIATPPPARTISTWNWDFGDPASGINNIASTTNPSHDFTGVNTYIVSLEQTSALGCKNKVTKPVFIVPYITSFPYQEGFESGNGGWVGVGTNKTGTNTWALGNPTGNKLNISASGTNAWFITKPTPSTTYDDNLRAVLNGPCVDVTQLNRPVLSFNYYSNTENNDGAYLETSTDGVNWSRLGVTNSGINWYNKGSIGGLSQFTSPGQFNGIGQLVSQIGWTGDTQNWQEARIALDQFLAATKLRIRYVFGSDPANSPGSLLDGFGIDDVSIDNRNRILLVETFTNENAPRYASNNAGFGTFTAEVAKIQYHTSFPTPDKQSVKNEKDNSARSAFYGINSNPGGSSLIPRSFIDGFTDAGSNQADFSSSSNWWTFLQSNRVLSVSPLDITITNPPTPISLGNNKISVNVSIKALEAVGKKNLILVIALVEKQADANNTFVMRKLIPSASGIPMSTPIAQNTVVNIPTQTFEVGDVNLSQLAVVAFVQDLENLPTTNSKEVLQAQVLLNPTNLPSIVTGLESILAEHVNLYPNPANEEFTLELPATLRSDARIRLIDQVGKSFESGILPMGKNVKTVSTQGLSEGMYIIEMSSSDGALIRKKVMVIH